jgi:hypothetical protein
MPTVREHFTQSDPIVRETYDKLLAVARTFGPMREDPKKTSIHFTRGSAFAGVATRKQSIILTLKAEADIRSPRVMKHQHTSPSRWHCDVRLEKPAQVDEELVGWLRRAYDLSA